MNIAINPEHPEYVAKIILKPKIDDMKVRNQYNRPSKMAGNLFVLYFAGIVICALVGII